MKITKKASLLAIAGLSLVTMTAQAQLDTTYNANDVLLGFRASSGNGSTTQLVFNLGPAQTYRNATSNSVTIATIGSSLSSTYGSTWYDRTDLWAGFVSAINGDPTDNSSDSGIGNSGSDVDPNSTIYVSNRRVTFPGTIGARGGSSIPTFEGTIPGGLVNALGAVFSSAQSSGEASLTNSTNNGWAFQDVSNSIVNVTGSGGGDFGQSYNIEAAFTSGSRGTFGAAGTVEQAWDFYRLTTFGTGAGTGTFEGTFTLNSSGDVSFITVPEPSTYALLGLGAIVGFIAYRRRLQKTA